MGKNNDINSTTLNTIRVMIFLPLKKLKKGLSANSSRAHSFGRSPSPPLRVPISPLFLSDSKAIAGHTTQVNFFHVRIRNSVPLLPHFSGALELIEFFVTVNVREPREERSMPMVARENSV